MISEAFKIHAEDIGHIPLHQQMLTWGDQKRRLRSCCRALWS